MSKQQRTFRESALLMRAAMRPTSVNESSRTAEVTWTTGAEVHRRDAVTGELFAEVLSLDPAHVRLGRLNNGAPLLDTHDATGIRRVLGVVDSARIDRGRGVAAVRFSRRPELDSLWRDVKDGIVSNVSVGYAVHKWSVQRAHGEQPEKRKAIDWEPMEISLVPVPADIGAQVRQYAGPPAKMAAAQGVAESIQAERQRTVQLTRIAREHSVAPELLLSWVRRGTSPEQARIEVAPN